jgi:hypothetical protein
LNLRHHHGYAGLHTREQAEGALPNGTRIRKVAVDGRDAHPVGTLGTVLGSIKAPPGMPADMPDPFGYFIEWDPTPRVAVFTRSGKIEVLE